MLRLLSKMLIFFNKFWKTTTPAGKLNLIFSLILMLLAFYIYTIPKQQSLEIYQFYQFFEKTNQLTNFVNNFENKQSNKLILFWITLLKIPLFFFCFVFYVFKNFYIIDISIYVKFEKYCDYFFGINKLTWVVEVFHNFLIYLLLEKIKNWVYFLILSVLALAIAYSIPNKKLKIFKEFLTDVKIISKISLLFLRLRLNIEIRLLLLKVKRFLVTLNSKAKLKILVYCWGKVYFIFNLIWSYGFLRVIFIFKLMCLFKSELTSIYNNRSLRVKLSSVWVFRQNWKENMLSIYLSILNLKVNVPQKLINVPTPLVYNFKIKYYLYNIMVYANFLFRKLFWLLSPLAICLVKIYLRVGLPIRILLRVLMLIYSMFYGFCFLLIKDFLNLISNVITFVKYSFFEIFLRIQFTVGCFVYFLVLGKLQVYDYLNLNITLESWNFTNYTKSFLSENFLSFFNLKLTPLVNSILVLLLLVEYGSLYFSLITAKKLMYSVYYIFIFSYLMLYWILPDFTIFNLFLFRFNGVLLIFMFIFRSLREDHRYFINLEINPYSYKQQSSIFLVKKHINIIYRFRDRKHSPVIEIISLLIFVLIFSNLVTDLRDYFSFTEVFERFGLSSEIQKYLILLFFCLRQSSYSYFFWFLAFSYLFIWNIFSLLVLTLTNFSYFGTLTDNLLNESNALGSLGLISSQYGFENLVFFNKTGTDSWYYGEYFAKKLENSDRLSKFDHLNFANSPFNAFGDMHNQPYLLTPHDDHNWTVNETLENNYFNSVKLLKTFSDSNVGDTVKYWPVDRNSYIWFGEFLENDLYYGWSHQVLIDTETFFDYSPYSLTNIFGDGLTQKILTDIFGAFVGPVELDQSHLLNLTDWGGNYSPGYRSNRVAGGAMSGLENISTLDKDQKIRENGETHHEWFPGLFVLDGRLDAKHSTTYVRLLIFLLIPAFIVTLWLTVLGKASNNFDENFGEMEVSNFNFFFFGNEQVETFSTYYWNTVYTSNYEWPIDRMSTDPIAYEPTNNLFEELFRHVSTGLFDYSILDSFFHLPILKHSEGFSTAGYKDTLMPILFPTGFDTDSAVVEDFSLFFENLKKITESSKKNAKTIKRSWPEIYSKRPYFSKYDVNLGIDNLWFAKREKVIQESHQNNKKRSYEMYIKNNKSLKLKPFFWKSFLLKFREFEKQPVAPNKKLIGVEDFKKYKSAKYLVKGKKLNNKLALEAIDYKKKLVNSHKDLDLFYKNTKYRSNFTNEEVISNENWTNFDIFNFEKENNDAAFLQNSGGAAENNQNNYELLNDLTLRSRKKIKFKNKLTLNSIKMLDKTKLKENYLNFQLNARNSQEIGSQWLNKEDPSASNINSVGEIDLDIYIKNSFENDILANAIAYEKNLEYSNLFESLILELISPGNHRYRDLEYEFENSNPVFSTVEDLADPEGNYAESGIFENDSIIDDPRTETILEIPGNDEYIEELWVGAAFREEGEMLFNTSLFKKRKFKKRKKKKKTRTKGNPRVSERSSFFWKNSSKKNKFKKNMGKHRRRKNQKTILNFNRNNLGVFKKKNFFSKNKTIWNPGASRTMFSGKFKKFFKKKKQKKFDAFTYQRNLAKRGASGLRFFNIWEPISKILSKYQLRFILKKKIKKIANYTNTTLSIYNKVIASKKLKNYDTKKLVITRILKSILKINMDIQERVGKNSLNFMNKNSKDTMDSYFTRLHSKKYFYVNHLSYFNFKNIYEIKFKSKQTKIFTYSKLFTNLNYKKYFNTVYKKINKMGKKNFRCNFSLKQYTQSEVWQNYKTFKFLKNFKPLDYNLIKIPYVKNWKNCINLHYSNFVSLNYLCLKKIENFIKVPKSEKSSFFFKKIIKKNQTIFFKKIRINKNLSLVLKKSKNFKTNNFSLVKKTISLPCKNRKFKSLKNIISIFTIQKNFKKIKTITNPRLYLFKKNNLTNLNKFTINEKFSSTKSNIIFKNKINMFTFYLKSKTTVKKPNKNKLIGLFIKSILVIEQVFEETKNSVIKTNVKSILAISVYIFMYLLGSLKLQNLKLVKLLQKYYFVCSLLNFKLKYVKIANLDMKDLVRIGKSLISFIYLKTVVLLYFDKLALNFARVNLSQNFTNILYLLKHIEKGINCLNRKTSYRITNKTLTLKIPKNLIRRYLHKAIPYSLKSVVCSDTQSNWGYKDAKCTLKTKNRSLNKNFNKIFKWFFLIKKFGVIIKKFFALQKKNKLTYKSNTTLLIFETISNSLKSLCVTMLLQLQKVIKKPMIIFNNPINNLQNVAKFLDVGKAKKVVIFLKPRSEIKTKLLKKLKTNSVFLSARRKMVGILPNYIEKDKKTKKKKTKEFLSFLSTYGRLKVFHIYNKSSGGLKQVRKKNLIKNWYILLQRPILKKKYAKYKGKGWVLNNAKTYLNLLNYNVNNKNSLNFYAEYGSIFITELSKQIYNGILMERIKNEKNSLMGKNQEMLNIWKNFENFDFKKLLANVNLKKNQRVWLKKKYPQFLYKFSIFLLVKSISDIDNNLNFYFYKDYTEITLKFLIKKIIWSSINLNYIDNLSKSLDTEIPSNFKKNNYKNTPLYNTLYTNFGRYSEKWQKFNSSYKNIIKNLTNVGEVNNSILLFILKLNSKQLEKYKSLLKTGIASMGNSKNNLNYETFFLGLKQQVYWFQKSKNIKKAIILPKAFKIREVWVKGVNFYTTIPTKLIYYYESYALLTLSGIFKTLVKEPFKKQSLTIKKIQMILKIKNKTDTSLVWYQEYFLKNKYTLFSGLLGITPNVNQELYVNLKQTIFYEFSIYKLFYLKKIWKILKFNFFITKNFKKQLLKKKANLFIFKFKNFSKKKKMNKLIWQKVNFIQNDSISNGQNTFKVKTSTNLVNFKGKLGIFIVNPLITSFSISNYFFSKYYFSFFLVDKIIFLLLLGFLRNDVKYLNNDYVYSKKKYINYNRDLLWVQKIYSNLWSIAKFSLKKSKIKKLNEYLVWRTFFFKKSTNVKIKKDSVKDWEVFNLLKKTLNFSRNYKKFWQLKSNFIKIPIYWIMKYFLNHFNTKRLFRGRETRLNYFQFLNNSSGSRLIRYFNQEQTKDFIINLIFYWENNKHTLRHNLLIFDWIDGLRIDWKKQKILIYRFRSILKIMVKLPYIKIIPIVASDFFLIINKIQPITSEDCLYYRDYTSSFIQKVVGYLYLKKLNIHVVKNKNISYIVDLVNFKFKNRLYWVKWFSKSTCVFKINYLKKYISEKSLELVTGDMRKRLLSKHQKLNVKAVGNLGLKKQKKSFDANIKELPGVIGNTAKTNSNLLKSIKNENNKSLKSTEMQPERWQFTRRFDTWTDSSNTSVTGITFFDEDVYLKNLLMFRDAWQTLSGYSAQFASHTDGLFGINDQPDLLEDFNYNTKHLANKKNNYVKLSSQKTDFSNNYWNSNKTNLHLKDMEEAEDVELDGWKRPDGTELFNKIITKPKNNAKSSKRRFNLRRRYINPDQFFHSLLALKNKISWRKGKPLTNHFSNLFDFSVMYSTNFNTNRTGLKNIWNLGKMGRKRQIKQILSTMGKVSGLAIDNKKIIKGLKWKKKKKRKIKRQQTNLKKSKKKKKINRAKKDRKQGYFRPSIKDSTEDTFKKREWFSDLESFSEEETGSDREIFNTEKKTKQENLFRINLDDNDMLTKFKNSYTSGILSRSKDEFDFKEDIVDKKPSSLPLAKSNVDARVANSRQWRDKNNLWLRLKKNELKNPKFLHKKYKNGNNTTSLSNHRFIEKLSLLIRKEKIHKIAQYSSIFNNWVSKPIVDYTTTSSILSVWSDYLPKNSNPFIYLNPKNFNEMLVDIPSFVNSWDYLNEAPENNLTVPQVFKNGFIGNAGFSNTGYLHKKYKGNLGFHNNYWQMSRLKKQKEGALAVSVTPESRMVLLKKKTFLEVFKQYMNKLLEDEKSSATKLILSPIDRKTPGIILRKPDSWDILNYEPQLPAISHKYAIKNSKLSQIRRKGGSNWEGSYYNNQLRFLVSEIKNTIRVNRLMKNKKYNRYKKLIFLLNFVNKGVSLRNPWTPYFKWKKSKLRSWYTPKITLTDYLNFTKKSHINNLLQNYKKHLKKRWITLNKGVGNFTQKNFSFKNKWGVSRDYRKFIWNPEYTKYYNIKGEVLTHKFYDDRLNLLKMKNFDKINIYGDIQNLGRYKNLYYLDMWKKEYSHKNYLKNKNIKEKLNAQGNNFRYDSWVTAADNLENFKKEYDDYLKIEKKRKEKYAEKLADYRSGLNQVGKANEVFSDSSNDLSSSYEDLDYLGFAHKEDIEQKYTDLFQKKFNIRKYWSEKDSAEWEDFIHDESDNWRRLRSTRKRIFKKTEMSIHDSTDFGKPFRITDLNKNQLTEKPESLQYSNQKKNFYIKNQYKPGSINKHITKDLFYKIIPTYIDGRWSGSDSGQTVLDYRRDSVQEKNPEYKVYNPIFGIFLLNANRLNYDLSKFGREFLESPFSLEYWKSKLFNFVSDYDTQFFDDKSLVFQNLWLFWLEFYRHLFINRWRLTLNYTKNEDSLNNNHKYPIGFIHEIYWFKYLVFSRFVKSLLKNSGLDIYLTNSAKPKKGKVANFLRVSSNGFLLCIFKKIKYNFLQEFLFINYFLKNNLNKTRLLKPLDKKNEFNSFAIKSRAKKTNRFIKIKNFFKRFPNHDIVTTDWVSNYTIIYSKSLNQKNNKRSNGVVSFLKPFRGTLSENYFQEDEFVLETETPIRNYVYFNNILDDDYEGDSVENNNNSDSENNNEYVSNYMDTGNQNFFKFFNETGKQKATHNLNKNQSFTGLQPNLFGKQKYKNLRNKYTKFRDVARKDSNLKYKRNWFFSNHIVNDWTLLTTYTGSWLKFSDFEPDRQRVRSRDTKHGSKYRLNFNTELWWTRTEPLDINFRRIDGLEFDVENGALDSDGEIFHLHKGLLDVVFLPENQDLNETVLPLFERSLLDPESPALNEDGEFPEFDLNVIYNTEIIKRLNLTKDWQSTKTPENKKIKKTDLTDTEQEDWVDNLFDNDNPSGKVGLLGNNSHKSLSFKTGLVDWKSKTFTDNQLGTEVISLQKSISFRKQLKNFGSAIISADNYHNLNNFNPLDLGSIIDALSVKDVHPISYSTEHIYSDLVDQKIDEALEYYALTKNNYANLFINYKNLKLNSQIKELHWGDIDFIAETNFDLFENVVGFDYELLLQKYASNYWKVILELDNSWNNAFTGAFPQIQDPVSNTEHYLPIWNYDPSYWETQGFDYEVTPLIMTDDSKMLVNSKISRFDVNYNWLSQKDLTTPGVAINSLGWGGSDITNGLAEHIPYDFLFGSDDDSDFEIYSELFFFKNLEDKDSAELDSSHLEYTKTSNTRSMEYPKNGFNIHEQRFKNFKNNIMFYMTQNMGIATSIGEIGARPLTRRFRKKRKNKLKKKVNYNHENFGINGEKKSTSIEVLSNKYDLKKKSYFEHGANIFLRGRKPSTFKSIDKFRDIIYQGPLGVGSGKSKIISNNFWKTMFFFFTNKYNNKLKKKNDLYETTRRKANDVLSFEATPHYFNYQGNLNLLDWSLNSQNFSKINKNAKKNQIVLKINNYLGLQNLPDFEKDLDYRRVQKGYLTNKSSLFLKKKDLSKFFLQTYILSKINKRFLGVKRKVLKKKIIIFFKIKINKTKLISILNTVGTAATLFKKRGKKILQNYWTKRQILKNRNSIFANLKQTDNLIIGSGKLIKFNKKYVRFSAQNLYYYFQTKKQQKVPAILLQKIITKHCLKHLKNLTRINKNVDLKEGDLVVFRKVGYLQKKYLIKSKVVRKHKKRNFYFLKKQLISKFRNEVTRSFQSGYLNSLLSKIRLNILVKKHIIVKNSPFSTLFTDFLVKNIKLHFHEYTKSRYASYFYTPTKLLQNLCVTDLFTYWKQTMISPIPEKLLTKYSFNLLNYSAYLPTLKLVYNVVQLLKTSVKLHYLKKIINAKIRLNLQNKLKLHLIVKIFKHTNTYRTNALLSRYFVKRAPLLTKIVNKVTVLKPQGFFVYFKKNKFTKNNLFLAKIIGKLKLQDSTLTFQNSAPWVKVNNNKKLLAKLTVKFLNLRNNAYLEKNILNTFKKSNEIGAGKEFVTFKKALKTTTTASRSHKILKKIIILKSKIKNKNLHKTIFLKKKISKQKFYKKKIYKSLKIVKNAVDVNREKLTRKTKPLFKIILNRAGDLVFQPFEHFLLKKKYLKFNNFTNLTENASQVIVTLPHNLAGADKKDSKFADLKSWSWWDELGTLALDLKNVENYSYFSSNFQLGTKRGGVGDTSHWSSGTEYLNEQFSRASSSFNFSYKTSDKNLRRNNKELFYNDQISEHTNYAAEYQTFRDIERFTEDPLKGHLTSPNSEIIRNLMSDNLNPVDFFYDNDSDQGVAFEQFSYIDWGFESDHDNLDSDLNFWQTDPFTGDIQRDASTESVYLDFIQLEYARELREFPEEIGDWTASDFYSEVFNKYEISEIPLSTNESELYSIDSSNSISDFILGVGIGSNLADNTLHISNEPSSEFEDRIFFNYKPGNAFYFDFFNKIKSIQHFEANITPNAHPEVDLFLSSGYFSNKNNNKFTDFFNKSSYDSKILEESSLRDWGDSNKMELEENTREPEFFSRQQNFIDSFYFESILDELLFQINLQNSQGLEFSLNQFLLKTKPKLPVAFKYILFTRTNYLKQYRGLMLDLNLERFMF